MVWDWVIDMTKKSTEKVYKWSQENKDRRREMTREAMVRYRERHKDDPDYIERTRETNRKTSKTFRQNIKTKPEEYEAFRAKERERLRKWRAKKKAEKESQSKENGPD